MSAAFPTSDNDTTSSLSSSAYLLSSRHRSDAEDDEVDSLPSGSASDSSLGADFSAYDSDDIDDESDAEEEWRESMRQLESLLTMVIIPFVGKFLGRKCAYWGWGKFMDWKYPLELEMGNGALSRHPGKQKASASL